MQPVFPYNMLRKRVDGRGTTMQTTTSSNPVLDALAGSPMIAEPLAERAAKVSAKVPKGIWDAIAINAQLFAAKPGREVFHGAVLSEKIARVSLRFPRSGGLIEMMAEQKRRHRPDRPGWGRVIRVWSTPSATIAFRLDSQ
jgi:hypothetical protein